MTEPTKLESALDELLSGKSTEEIVGPDGLLNLRLEGPIAVARHFDLYRPELPLYLLPAPAVAVVAAAAPFRRVLLIAEMVALSNSQTPGCSAPYARCRAGIPKHERRFSGLDEKILSMYARGMSTRDIQGHLEEMYGVEVSPALISQVTDAVLDEVRAWQNRPLDPIYLIVYLDALFVKMRHEGRVENRAVFVGIGVTQEGTKEVLGLWTSATEGAKLWLQILTELRNRGIQDILVACVDGLKGFPDAIGSAFPKTTVQLCIVHMVRNSLAFVNWKERKTVAPDLRLIYRAATVEEAEQRLAEFEASWDAKYAAIGKMWRRHWAGIVPLFAFPEEIRRAIYTTSVVESLHMTLRKVIKTRASFPSEESALKLLYLALQNVSKRWKPAPNWRTALNHFTLLYGDRMEAAWNRPAR